MKKLILTLTLIFSLIHYSKADAKSDEFDVYLMIGQSNMAGRGEFEACDTMEYAEGVYLLDSEGKPTNAISPFNRYSTIRKELSLQGYSPANKFSELMHSRSGRKILIVSNARGGSSIDHWLPGDRHDFLGEAVRRTRQAMHYGTLKGIVWHQGETNIQKGLTGYIEKFTAMITALRDSLGVGEVPVVIGQVGQWKWAPTEDIMAFNDSVVPNIAEKVANCKYVSSNGLARRYRDKESDPHFGRKAQMELGRRYADAMVLLTDSIFITEFKDGKRGAVSFTFDDGDLDHYLLVAPELEKRGFRGTFWISGDKINKGDSVRPRMTWPQLREMADRGHEISNHSFTHAKLVQMSPEEVRRDIEMNDSAIVRNVGKRPVTFCYPFNGYPDWLVKIAEEGRVGSRTHQTGIGQQNNKSTREKLCSWTDNVIKNGEWGVTMIHGITTGYDKWYEPQKLWDFFDYVKANNSDLWVAPFCDVAEYRKLRDNINLSVVKAEDRIEIHTASPLDTSLFSSKVTIALKGEWNKKQVKAIRDGKAVSTSIKDDLLLLDMYPSDKVTIMF